MVFFYLCDLVCVLVWCPFRVFLMKNRCCTTCRIFNWDHLMMFAPFLFLPGFYGWSLLGMSVVTFAVWEIAFRLHPERFWEGSNQALKCKTELTGCAENENQKAARLTRTAFWILTYPECTCQWRRRPACRPPWPG